MRRRGGRIGGAGWLLGGFLVLTGLLGGPAEAAEAAVITVTTADGGAPAVDGLCSLREAIQNARANALTHADCLAAGEAAPTLDEIRFNIGGGGPQTIALTSALATLTGGPLTVDATTQPGPGALPRITLDGAAAGAGSFGFSATGADVTIRGFAIVNFAGGGIEVNAGAQRTAIEGNYIGLERTGQTAQPNTVGITLPSAFTTTIGGTGVSQRNVISGNTGAGITIAGGNTVTILGNLIGTTAAGTTAVPNGGAGIQAGPTAFATTIGGTASGAGNVISGNGSHGIAGTGANVRLTIQGNRIGTNQDGTTAVPNGGNGVRLDAVQAPTVGGTASGAGNQISGNTLNGVLVTGNASATIQGNLIGLTASGLAALANQQHGVRFEDGRGDVGGTTAAARNVISGNTLSGVSVDAESSNVGIRANLIGTNQSGTAVVANRAHGIQISGTNHAIGGNTAAEGNLIAGNLLNGISFEVAQLTDVRRNLIGTEITGASGLPNGGAGVSVVDSSRIAIGNAGATGGGNTIAFNGGAGVAVTGISDRIGIVENSIFGNGGLGIDLGTAGVTPNDTGDGDGGPNTLQNFPVITAASVGTNLTVTGTLNTTPNTNGIRIQLFSNAACDPSGNGEGRTFLGEATASTDAGGNAAWIAPGLPPVAAGTFITATASTLSGASVITSEFSACKAVATAGSGAITVSPAQVTTTEAGGTGVFTVVLTSVPTADVTITLASSDTTEGTVSPASLTFTPANALTPQAVTVTGVDDGIVDGDVAYTILTGAAVSADPAFNGINPADVAATNLDNEGAPRIIVSTAQVVTTEGGGKAQFTVVLSALSTANVTISLSSSDATEGTVSPASLTFTPANALTPQVVTVTGVDDTDPDGNVAYTIITGVAVSADPAFNGVNPPDVAATNLDDDTSVPSANNEGQGESGKPKNERADSVRETETARQQRERTNRSGSDDYRTEGNVVAVDLEASPRTATIATRDGLQVIVLLCRDSCAEPKVGDYLEADGVKEHEALFYADSVTSKR